jgi:hypothetical protein
MADIIQRLAALSDVPNDDAGFDTWLTCQDALALLKQNVQEQELVMYASFQHVFIHTVGVPASRLDPVDVDDLLEWNFNAHDDSWGASYSFNPPEVTVEPPLSSTSSKTLDRGTKFIFPRSFDGLLGEKHYFEVLQEFTHLLGLHFVPERRAYCRLDDRGDVEDMVRIIHIDRTASDLGGTVILFRRETVDEWMTLTDSALVQMFDFTRVRLSDFSGWGYTDPKVTVDGDLMYRFALESGKGSYARGVQIVRSNTTKDALFEHLGWYPGKKKAERQYASFIAFDFKNNRITEISTDPGGTANYFTKSDLPFETSPAFFRAEVLQKYKADSDKYRLDERSIGCRGAWHLKTYDINEQGQVHTYICYLRTLPYDEQLYWKAYNEPPKGPISRRALTTDFKGECYLDYDALPSVKQLLTEWDRKQVGWWRLRGEKLIDQVHYPVTSAADEWGSELMQLHQLLVEGFEEKWLRKKAQELGRTPDPKLRSLKLIEECLIGLGYEEEHARKMTAPLHQLNDLRSKVKGHASGEEATALKRKALSTYGTFRKHFEAFCAECDESIRDIEEAFKAR